MNLNFPHSPESHQRSIAARWQPEEHRRLPYLEHCNYDKFLAILAERHGQDYLYRPDGALLDGIVALPKVAAKPKSVPTIAPPEPQITFSDNVKKAPVNVRARLIKVLTDGPKTLGEITKITGMSSRQIVGAISRDGGETFRRMNITQHGDKWELITENTGPRPDRAPSMVERITEYLRTNKPSTVYEIAAALETTSHTVTLAINRARGEFVSLGRSGKSKVWTLRP